MKHVLAILIFSALVSCSRDGNDRIGVDEISTETISPNLSGTEEAGELLEDIDSPSDTALYQDGLLSEEFDHVTLYQLSDSIIADFNGDGYDDVAIYKKEEGTSGLIINHKHANEIIRIGFRQPFYHLADFNWVDIWGIVRDSVTYEVIIEESEIIGDQRIALENPSFVLRKEEAGGGLITFRNGRYEWIHQAD